jgi:glycine dehydrogenase subunit 1
MPFIPHTEDDVAQMLAAIGATTIDQLFDEIPAALRNSQLDGVPPALNEAEISRLMQQRATRDGQPLSFIGAGGYEHHIPAAVWQIVSRGEFYSAYTPYQAEASQGTLQVIYEFQSMIAGMMAMDAANASLYDGASALAEAVLMAVRSNNRTTSRRILFPAAINPIYRRVVETLCRNQGITLHLAAYDASHGTTPVEALIAAAADEPFAALVIAQPNFFGQIEEVDHLTDWAQQQGAIVIGVVNPVAMALLKPPGDWGSNGGAEIACGEGQPLGIPLSSGGPWLGLLACKQPLLRQMPGRIVGRTVDLEGKPGFTLTLQAREQHIRRSRATSNICTNQGLIATAATLYMSLMGPVGLERVAATSHLRSQQLRQRLLAIDGVEAIFDGASFHEMVIRLSEPVNEILRALAVQDILGGYPLGELYPELDNCLLICTTECRNEGDLDRLAEHLQRILSRRGNRQGCVKLKPQDPAKWGFTNRDE